MTYATLSVEFEIESAIRKIPRAAYRLDDNHLKLTSKSVKSLVKAEAHNMELVDGLTFDDALLVCACLERAGFRAGRDYGVYRCGVRYGLLIKRECLSTVDPMLRDLCGMRIVWRTASTILRERRRMFGKYCGDIYEALELTYMVIVVRNSIRNRQASHSQSFTAIFPFGTMCTP